jgi:YedE family putative selenium metabolism protein
MLVLATGIVFGLGAVLLVMAGNPGNYGFCAACQLRDIAGALHIQSVATLQYVRPEILGWVLGAFAMAKFRGEFRSRGGASPVTRFILGMAMMVGALVFLGCPLRGLLRLAGGDLNGLTGLIGFVAGVGAGIVFLRRGYSLGKSSPHGGAVSATGYGLPLVALLLFIAVAFRLPMLAFSKQGPGAMHAPVLISLVAGLAAGLLAQRSRLCMSGGIRDFFLTSNTQLLRIYAVIFLAAVAGNLYFGLFKLGFRAQPLAHTMHLWNFLGLFLVGLAATLAGGCPLRQLISSGEGSTDAAWCVLGMLAGAGLAHRLNAAGAPAGVGINGQIAVIVGILATAAIGLALCKRQVALAGSAAAGQSS